MPCSFYSRWLHQRTPNPKVQDLIDQINILKVLKRHGRSISNGSPENGQYNVSVLVFADASQQNGHVKLFYLAGLLSGNLTSGSTFNTLSCISHKSQCLVKSVTAKETLAAGEAIDEVKSLLKAIKELLCTEAKLAIVVDSKDLFISFSTCGLASNRIIRGNVSSIRFAFAIKNVSYMI